MHSGDATAAAEVVQPKRRLSAPRHHFGDEDGHRDIAQTAVPRDSGHASDTFALLVSVVPKLSTRVRSRRVVSNSPLRAPASLPGHEGARIFYALLAPPPRKPPLSSGTTDTTLTKGAKHETQPTADSTVASAPDVYDVAVDKALHHRR
ncbi:hypothetical protein HPB49_011293 [Dermacentor silvarum]|uniref:Uncharacterized protein n=1 Tax=Dermacentor silvarum TaxID=543639 RepID=A0ACB8DCQ3_DERSI|nr:hypothetical protein HPB49_011293 [Dermacentor silvarum]